MAKTKFRNVVVSVRLTPKDRKVIDRAATKRNQSLSEFIRACAIVVASGPTRSGGA